MDNTMLESNNSKRIALKRAPKKYLIVGLICTLVIVVFVLTLEKYFTNQKNILVPKKNDALSVRGTMYLTLTPSSGMYKNSTDVYFLNNEKHLLTHFFDPDQTSSSMTARSSSKNSIVFSILKHAMTEPHGLETSIAYFDLVSTSSQRKSVYLKDNVIAADSKQFPSWSEKLGGAIYMTLATSSNISLPEDSTISFASNTENHDVTKGLYPQFLPDGSSFMVLKNDGLYLMRMGQNDAKKVISPPNATVKSHDSFDISLDGTKLVWNQVDVNKIYLYDISKVTNGGEAALLSIIKIRGLWPTLSPDGNQIAMIHSDKTSTGDRIQNLVSIDWHDKTYKDILDLSSYILNRTSISDWVTNNNY